MDKMNTSTPSQLMQREPFQHCDSRVTQILSSSMIHQKTYGSEGRGNQWWKYGGNDKYI